MLGKLPASVDRRSLYSAVAEAVHDLVNSFTGGEGYLGLRFHNILISMATLTGIYGPNRFRHVYCYHTRQDWLAT